MAQEEKSFNQVLNERRSIRAFKNNAEDDADQTTQNFISIR